MPEDMPDRLPDKMPEDMSEYMPEDMPDRMPDRMPEDLPDRMPEDMPEDMPDRMPEDIGVVFLLSLLQPPCHRQHVGAQRLPSKVPQYTVVSVKLLNQHFLLMMIGV